MNQVNEIDYKVPLIPQEGPYTCWLAAYLMVEAWYNTVCPKRPAKWSPTQLKRISKLGSAYSLQPQGVPVFASSVGMTVIQESRQTPDGLMDLLSTYGPLWYGGKNNGLGGSMAAGHVFVIRGIKGELVFVNNPWETRVGQENQFMAVSTLFEALQPYTSPASFLVMLKGSAPLNPVK